jgi:hypothetical protein
MSHHLQLLCLEKDFEKDLRLPKKQRKGGFQHRWQTGILVYRF